MRRKAEKEVTPRNEEKLYRLHRNHPQHPQGLLAPLALLDSKNAALTYGFVQKWVIPGYPTKMMLDYRILIDF